MARRAMTTALAGARRPVRRQRLRHSAAARADRFAALGRLAAMWLVRGDCAADVASTCGAVELRRRRLQIWRRACARRAGGGFGCLRRGVARRMRRTGSDSPRRASCSGVGGSAHVRGRRVSGQRDQADIGAAADALQHHVADADRRFDAALLQRVVARLVEAGLGEIAEAEQRTRGVAGADEHAVARKRRDRRDRCPRPDVAAVRPAAWCGRRFARPQPECRGCRRRNRAARSRRSTSMPSGGAEAAQPLQPDRAVRRQPAREPRDLAPMRIGRAENLCGECAPLAAPNRRAPTGLAHRIRVPSVDHSHAGSALVACTASRGSPTPRNWNSALFIATT